MSLFSLPKGVARQLFFFLPTASLLTRRNCSISTEHLPLAPANAETPFLFAITAGV